MKKVKHSPLFLIALFFKGIDGILEIIGGFLIFLIDPVLLNKIFILLTQHELSEDPNDFIANYIVQISHSYSVNTQHFAIFYLFSHGFIKVWLVISLFKERLWAYPAAILFLSIFSGYQLYRYNITHSIFLLLLTIFDLFIILLTWKEYKKVKSSQETV